MVDICTWSCSSSYVAWWPYLHDLRATGRALVGARFGLRRLPHLHALGTCCVQLVLRSSRRHVTRRLPVRVDPGTSSRSSSFVGLSALLPRYSCRCRSDSTRPNCRRLAIAQEFHFGIALEVTTGTLNRCPRLLLLPGLPFSVSWLTLLRSTFCLDPGVCVLAMSSKTSSYTSGWRPGVACLVTTCCSFRASGEVRRSI